MCALELHRNPMYKGERESIKVFGFLCWEREGEENEVRKRDWCCLAGCCILSIKNTETEIEKKNEYFPYPSAIFLHNLFLSRAFFPHLFLVIKIWRKGSSGKIPCTLLYYKNVCVCEWILYVCMWKCLRCFHSEFILFDIIIKFKISQQLHVGVGKEV